MLPALSHACCMMICPHMLSACWMPWDGWFCVCTCVGYAADAKDDLPRRSSRRCGTCSSFYCFRCLKGCLSLSLLHLNILHALQVTCSLMTLLKMSLMVAMLLKVMMVNDQACNDAWHSLSCTQPSFHCMLSVPGNGEIGMMICSLHAVQCCPGKGVLSC